jgi:hypothetical protein
MQVPDAGARLHHQVFLAALHGQATEPRTTFGSRATLAIHMPRATRRTGKTKVTGAAPTKRAPTQFWYKQFRRIIFETKTFLRSETFAHDASWKYRGPLALAMNAPGNWPSIQRASRGWQNIKFNKCWQPCWPAPASPRQHWPLANPHKSGAVASLVHFGDVF